MRFFIVYFQETHVTCSIHLRGEMSSAYITNMFGARLDLASLSKEAPVKVKTPFTLKRRREEPEEKEAGPSGLSDDLSDGSDDLSDDSSESDSSDSDSDSSDSDSNSSESESSDGDSDKSNESKAPIIKATVTVPVIEKAVDSDNMQLDVDDEYTAKHSSIFLKFKQVDSTDIDIPKVEPVNQELQDLAPLPQPALPRDKILTSKNTHSKNLDWLADPDYAVPANTKSFKEFNLSPIIQSNLEKLKYTEAFSVQIEVMNLLFSDAKANKLQPDTKGDILVNAATGSGKTLAYLIPIIENLQHRIVPRVRAVILVPTKPLINQVFQTMSEISNGTQLRILTLRTDVSVKEEANKLSNAPDIIISTPGRLVEHLTNGTITLKNLQYLVIDEADRLLNQSFQNWAKILISKIDTEVNLSEKWKLGVKKLIFSATLTTDASKLSVLKFTKPRLIIVNDQKQLVNEIFSVPNTLTEYQIRLPSATSSMKPLILAKFLMSTNKLKNVLVFTKSNESSLRLAKLLELLFERLLTRKDFEVAYINSTNNKTAIRSRILRDFSEQKINILVATDLIARGIDVASITDVINYDMPNSSREYIHRVGRTARANNPGNAFNFLFGKDETQWFYSMMKHVGRGGKFVEHSDFDYRDTMSDLDEKVYSDCLVELQKQVLAK